MTGFKNQQGVTFVPVVILAAVVLGVIGGAIYVSMHSKNAASVSSPTPSLSASSTPTTSPSAAATKLSNEFDVSELGFKMTLPTGLSGLTYSVQMNQTGNYNGQSYTASTARFSTTSLVNADPSHCGTTDSPVGAISYYPSFNPSVLSDSPKIKKLDAGYLAFTGPQGECSTNASADSIQSANWPLLSQAFETASPL
jgi:hypothetical protein